LFTTLRTPQSLAGKGPIVKKRLPIAITALCFILLGIALALPRTHYAIQGWFRGEAYFAGQPTSYWLGAVKKEPFVGDQGDVFKKLREGGPAAVPVLCQLFMDEDGAICQQASLAISLIDWEAQGMSPAVAEALVSVDSLDLFQRTVARLASESRLTLKERLAEELKNKARPRSRGAAALALASLGDDGRSELLRVAMVDGALGVRVHAAISLWHSKDHADDILWTLVAGLQGPNPKISKLASGALKNIGPAANDAVQSAVISLLRSNDVVVRENAASILGTMVPSEAASNGLLQAIRDEDVLVRYEASSALVSKKVPLSKEAISVLFAALEDAREARPRTAWRLHYVRSNVVRLLGPFAREDKVVLDKLVDTFRQDRETWVRTTAVATLAAISPPSLEVVDLLCDALRHDVTPTVRIQIADKFKEMGKGAEAALPSLIASLVEEKDPAVRSRVASAVVEIATDEGQLEGLLTALKDNRDDSVRVAIAQTLGQIKFSSEKVVGSLLQALEDKSVGVRLEAVAALGQPRFRSERVVGSLVRALEDKDVGVRLETARALGCVDPGNAAAIRTLRQLLVAREEKNNPTAPIQLAFGGRRGPILVQDVRPQAIQVLAQFGATAKAALPDLIGLWNQDQSGLRFNLMGAMGEMGVEAKAALPKIKQELKSSVVSYRIAAAQALWKIDRNAELAVPVLIDALGNDRPEFWARAEAAAELGKIGPQARAAIPRLRELSADTDAAVRKAAKEALAKITGDPAPKDEPEVGTAAPGHK
jgi:HEAT repeat protein